MKPRKYEQGWERDDRIADFPEWVEEAEYETEMYRKHGHKRRPEDDRGIRGQSGESERSDA